MPHIGISILAVCRMICLSHEPSLMEKVLGSTPDRSTRLSFFRLCLCHSLSYTSFSYNDVLLCWNNLKYEITYIEEGQFVKRILLKDLNTHFVNTTSLKHWQILKFNGVFPTLKHLIFFYIIISLRIVSTYVFKTSNVAVRVRRHFLLQKAVKMKS